MKVIKSDSGFLAYQKIFKHVHNNQSELVLWQISATGERNISRSRLNSFHLDTGLLHFEKATDLAFADETVLFCYCEDEQFIFKAHIQNVKDAVFTVEVPPEIKLLEESDIHVIKGQIGVDLTDTWKTKRLNVDVPGSSNGPDYMRVKSMAERSSRDQEFLNNEFDSVSLDEEEKLFAGKRESPRARPKIDKWVKIKTDSSDEVHFLRLFDLSRGGIGFLTMDVHLFPKGSSINVVGFEEFDLDDPLVGVIMSHRAIDETQIEFKIGVKFNEGQG